MAVRSRVLPSASTASGDARARRSVASVSASPRAAARKTRSFLGDCLALLLSSMPVRSSSSSLRNRKLLDSGESSRESRLSSSESASSRGLMPSSLSAPPALLWVRREMKAEM